MLYIFFLRQVKVFRAKVTFSDNWRKLDERTGGLGLIESCFAISAIVRPVDLISGLFFHEQIAANQMMKAGDKRVFMAF